MNSSVQAKAPATAQLKLSRARCFRSVEGTQHSLSPISVDLLLRGPAEKVVLDSVLW